MSGALPRLVVAAPSSGAGKTTVATGLMAALAARGLAVSGHKVGPDYIDPGYHALACGRPGRNLDPVLCGEHRIAPLLRHGAAGCDVAVIEGVMGLYDGRAGTDTGSTAHVARLTGSPVLLVVDAAAQSRSVAALVAGFRDFDPRVQLAGVLLNRVGSDRHEQLLREALAGIGMPVLGALRRDDLLAAPSRHLGLVPAAERRPEATATVRRLGQAVAAGTDLDAVLALARAAAPLADPPWSPPLSPGAARPVVGVAGGAAFTFGYAETVELLAAAGAQPVTVDPLRDERLPDGCAGLYLGGGFPEVHVADLAGNGRLLAEIRRFDGPIYAECAGLLYLCRTLDGHPMAGRVPADARMTDRLTLGYRDAAVPDPRPGPGAGDCPPGPGAAGTVTGHEFHRTAVTPGHGAEPAWLLDGRPEGFAGRRLSASYLHVHWAGHPRLAARFVEACGAAA